MKIQSMLFISGPLLLVACSSVQQLHRGSIVMKTSDTEAHVCVGESEAQRGDTVNVFRSACVQKRTGSTKEPSFNVVCTKTKVGQGKITRTYNEHYSVAEFERNANFKEGDIVEVESHGPGHQ